MGDDHLLIGSINTNEHGIVVWTYNCTASQMKSSLMFLRGVMSNMTTRLTSARGVLLWRMSSASWMPSRYFSGRYVPSSSCATTSTQLLPALKRADLVFEHNILRGV